MIDSLVYEAKLIGFKEGFKIGLVWLVCYSYFIVNNRKYLIKSFYAGLACAALISVASLLVMRELVPAELIGNSISMSFALFLTSSGAALYNSAKINTSGSHEAGYEVISVIAVFSAAMIFFLPDLAGTLFFLYDLSVMKETAMPVSVSALAGFLFPLILIITVVKFYRPFLLGSFFALPQLLLFLAMVKLFGSGIKGFAELTLVPAVQRGFMKFIHDLVHQTFVILMVPDHPLLKKTTWNFIGIFFGPNFASAASLFILLTIPLVFIYFSIFRPVPEPGADGKVERRKIKSLILSDRRKKAIPVSIFVVFILTAWFSYRGETVSRIYQPEARPVVADRGMVVIPLKDPAMDLMDGRLHKFSLMYEGEEIRINVIKKDDNSLSICLDACELCPPAGYGQRDDHVVCIYCNTPIPVHTLGEAGGCNPIPLSSEIDEKYIRIEMNEIVKKWGFVQAGKTGRVSK